MFVGARTAVFRQPREYTLGVGVGVYVCGGAGLRDAQKPDKKSQKRGDEGGKKKGGIVESVKRKVGPPPAWSSLRCVPKSPARQCALDSSDVRVTSNCASLSSLRPSGLLFVVVAAVCVPAGLCDAFVRCVACTVCGTRCS